MMPTLKPVLKSLFPSAQVLTINKLELIEKARTEEENISGRREITMTEVGDLFDLLDFNGSGSLTAQEILTSYLVGNLTREH